MAYFSKAFIKFFKDLEKNNNRDWFLANKAIYLKEVKTPMESFIADLIGQIAHDDNRITQTAKEAIFRINRDVRFSIDKSPYKTHTSAAISAGGKKDFVMPGTYIELSYDGLGVYGGIYQPEKENLQKIREYIANNLTEFAKLLKEPGFVKYYGSIRGEQNKKVPKEFAEFILEQPLILNKQFYYFTRIGKEVLTADNLLVEVMERYFAAKNMKNFLTEAVLS